MASFYTPDRSKGTLDQYDMFDRIINVKLTVNNKATGEVDQKLIIRSDWAPYKNTDGTYNIRRCEHKPSIQVQYKKAAGDLAAQVELYVSNYFLLTADGRMLASFNKNTMDITRVEIVMGYFGQFKRVRHATYNDLLDMTPPGGASMITCDTVVYVSTDSLPPDYRLHVSIAIGDILNAKYNAEDADVLYDNFIRNSANTYTFRGDSDRSGDYTKGNVAPALQNIVKYYDQASRSKGGKGYGSAYSDGVSKLSVAELIPASGSGGVSQTLTVNCTNGNTLTEAINMFANYTRVENLKCTIVTDTTGRYEGTIFFFLESELCDIIKLGAQAWAKDVFKDSVFSNDYGNTLPAVSNICVDAVATITCPFFAFIDPFQSFSFRARYQTSKLAKYYLEGGSDNFLATSVKVSFATVDDVNDMEIVCIPEPKSA